MASKALSRGFHPTLGGAISARAAAAARLRNFLRDLYAHRRKNLRGALAACPSGRRDKTAVDRRLAELGIDGTLRAETLTVEDHWRLCQVFG